MLNKVMVIGRLGREPELKYSQQGAAVYSFSVATDESYTGNDGNKIERTEWHRVSAFSRLAETCSKFLRKGSLVYIEGSLQTRKWQGQDGQERSVTEIKAQRVQFLERRDQQDEGPRFPQSSPQARPVQPAQQRQQPAPVQQQEIPGWNVPPTDEVPF